MKRCGFDIVETSAGTTNLETLRQVHTYILLIEQREGSEVAAGVTSRGSRPVLVTGRGTVLATGRGEGL